MYFSSSYKYDTAQRQRRKRTNFFAVYESVLSMRTSLDFRIL